MFTRLFISFMSIIFILVLVGEYSIWNIKDTNEYIQHISFISYPVNQYAIELDRGADYLWIGTFLYASGDTSFGKQYIKNGKRMMEESIENLNGLNVQMSEILPKEESVLETQQKVIDIIDTDPESKNKIEFGLRLLQQRIGALDVELDDLAEHSQEEMTKGIDSLTFAKERGETTIKLTLILIIVSLLISSILSVFLSRSVSKPLKELSQTVDEISRGNFNVDIKKTSNIKEIATLEDSLRRIIVSMKLAVLRLQERKETAPVSSKNKK